jgi:flagella basal body P-ring formation protein FlgA
MLVRGQVETAQRAALTEAGHDAAQVEITLRGASPSLLSPGTLTFPWSGLAKPAVAGPKTVLFWRGELRTVANTTVPVWARVQLSERRRGVLARQALRAGQTITADDVHESEWDASLFEPAPAPTRESTVGQVLSRAVGAGRPVLLSMLGGDSGVRRGEMITVESIEGAARLRFTVTAENSAPPGARVYFRSPLGGKRISAQVVASRLARISSGGAP